MNTQKLRTLFAAQRLALVVGVALLIVKLLAWWWTNSNAILTDALESIINVVAAGMGLYSLWLSAQPRDRNHPYGHGKVEFISAGVEGALIMLAGISILAKASYNIAYPQTISRLDVGLIITAVAGAINYLLGWYLQRQGRGSHSIVLVASGAHLKSDAYSSAGLVLGLGLVWVTGSPVLDSLLALVFGAIIIYTGIRLVRESVAGIMDEADYQLIREMVEALQAARQDDWIDVHNFRVIKYGSTLHIDCHITLPWYYTVDQAHDEVKAFERVLEDFSSAPVELFVHVDPCEPPENCRLCPLADCPERQAPQQERIVWTLDNIMKDQKHEI
ncbi:MAG: cation diffusion facilitator family transporter [Bacteroidetes bacterium]|nr:cation diffusion facilitator family transporter [Bacteroidota bacterium]